MKRGSRIFCSYTLVFILVACAAFLSPNQVTAQSRLERPPSRNLEGTPPIVGGRNSIPEGTVLILEMETPLSSKHSRVSDRFRALVATPVVDENGNTIISTNSTIEGRVSSVRPARWPRRSGIISITFDKLRLENGREYPIRGILTAVSPEERKRLDDERNLKAGSTIVRDAFFVGGGAGAGAAIGAIAGSALAGAGIGAAVGVTAALLTKGKEAVVEPGQRFGLELIQPLRLGLSTSTRETARASTGLPVRSRRSTTGFPSSTRVPSVSLPISGDSGAGVSGVPVDVSFVRAERGADGIIRILVIAETPTTGWRIYTSHNVVGDAVRVRLRGVQPSSGSLSQVSHPASPTIKVSDNFGNINRIVVTAKNGTRETLVGASAGSEYVGSTTPPVTTPRPRPVTPRPVATPRPVTPSTGIPTTPVPGSTALGTRVVNQITQIRYDFGATVGVWINSDGSYDAIGQRQPTADQRRLLDTLGSLLNSVKAYNVSPNSTMGAKVLEDANLIEQTWQKVRLDQDLNQKFVNMLKDVRTLVSATQGVTEPPPDVTDTPAPPTPSTTPVSAEASRVVGSIQQAQFGLGTVVGAFINPDGTYEVIGSRQPTPDEKQMLDGMTDLLNSVRAVGSTSSSIPRRNTAARMREEANSVEQAWKRVRMTADLNQKFTTMLRDVRAFADSISR
jgi:hypothetical protein